MRSEIFRMLSVLCYAAMHKLIHGAELSSCSKPTNMGISTGDLGNVQKGNTLALGYSLDATSFKELFDEADEEGSGFEMLASPIAPQPISECNLSDYAFVDTLLVNSSDELEMQYKFLEMRKLFGLHIDELIVEETTGIHIYDKVRNTFISGTLYFTRNSLHFASTHSPNSAPSSSKLTSHITPISSALFDASSDCAYLLTMTPSHVVSVKKSSTQPAGIKGVASAFLFSGFTIVQTRSKFEFWFAFQSVKARDKLHDTLLLRIKNTSQDEEFEVGERNGMPKQQIDRSSIFQITRKESSLSFDAAPTDELVGFEHLMQKIDKSEIAIFTTPLKYIFKSFYTPDQDLSDTSLPLWFEHFNAYGKDACMVKNVKAIRELLVKTCGVPTALRGDFWLLASGAWNSRLVKDTYVNLLRDNAGKSNASSDEIEKDVRRSLPEHTAYQSKAGIGALRRVLTSYSFRNPSIGYAQALNIISAILLLHLKEEDAFQMLSTLVEKIVPDHYSKTLVGSVVDQQVFTHLVTQFMPSLTSHMASKYMEMSTFTVPWFVCLFLNTISLKVNAIILDAFFLDGSKFLLWFGLAIVKLNEKLLLTKRDDELFMNVFKGFFERLATPADDSVSDMKYAQTLTLSDEIFQKMTGAPLMQYTLWICYSQFSQHVTNEIVESLRVKFMLLSVHQMEESYQKSQIRDICELCVKMPQEEVLTVYRELRLLEFLRTERSEQAATDLEYASLVVEYVVGKGAWGYTKNKTRFKTAQMSSDSSMKKSIPLAEFKHVFSKISPWRSQTAPPMPQGPPPTPTPTHTGQRRQSLMPIITKRKQLSEDHQLLITDRLYFYTAFTNVSPTGAPPVAYTVDLGNMLQLLESISKQPLQQKLRLLFDIHDLDGDGFLNKTELKATMDSLLEMFEGARSRFGEACESDEFYFRAVSTFLGIALKSGNDRAGEKAKAAEEERDRARSRSFSAGGVLCGEDGYKLGFHEFLLSMLSQSVFVGFFEKTWDILCDEAGIRLTAASTGI